MMTRIIVVWADLNRWHQRTILETLDAQMWMTYVQKVTLLPKGARVSHLMPMVTFESTTDEFLLTELDVVAIQGDPLANPKALITIITLPAHGAPHVVATVLTERGRMTLRHLREVTIG